MMKCIHGEVVFVERKIPKGANRLTVKDGYYVVGESETHGNDHRVAVMDGVEVYEHEGTLFVRNTVDTEIYCPNKERHDTRILPPSEWEIKKAHDFDFLADTERRVQD